MEGSRESVILIREVCRCRESRSRRVAFETTKGSQRSKVQMVLGGLSVDVRRSMWQLEMGEKDDVGRKKALAVDGGMVVDGGEGTQIRSSGAT